MLADLKKWTWRGIKIPNRMHRGIMAYMVDHEKPGDFLMAVFRNDLTEACARADDENKVMLFVYIGYLYNEAPSESWGSPKKVEAWLAAEADEYIKVGRTD